jgi:hypothetical protein
MTEFCLIFKFSSTINLKMHRIRLANQNMLPTAALEYKIKQKYLLKIQQKKQN